MNSRRKIRILVVDDDEQNRYLLKLLLKNRSYAVELARDGREDLKLARARVPDLVISDILMPVMDGFKLCQEWRADPDLKKQPFVFYTATYTDPKDEIFALNLGANRFIVKPKEPEELIALIVEVLEQQERGELSSGSTTTTQKRVLLKEYNAALVRKLEDKMLQLKKTRSQLENKIGELESSGLILEENKRRFRDFAEIAADWFFETSSDLKIRTVSQRYETVTGFTDKDIVGKPLIEYLSASSASSLPQPVISQLEQNLPTDEFECAQKTKNGKELILRYRGKPFFDGEDRLIGYRFVARDITASYLLSKKISHQAAHDALTGLVNRWEFDRRLHRLLTGLDSNSEHVLCYLDVDQFKIVNDISGHIVGDGVLKQLANVLAKCVRERDTLARLGGDEFAILMEHCTLEQATRVAEKARDAIRNYLFQFDKRKFDITVSIGVVDISQLGSNYSDVLSAADAACYAAKERGGDSVYIYQHDDADIERRHGDMKWTNRINHALNNDRFILYAQTIVPVIESEREDKRYEILIRMIDQEGELVLPGHFLPAAEKYNLMQKIDRWVIETLFSWLAHDSEQPGRKPIFSINLSGNSLGNNELLSYLLDQFSHRIDPRQICFEITETLAVENYFQANDFIARLRKLGCQFAIDDFGSGVCSFAYLIELEFDYVKIDGIFIRDICENPIKKAVVKSINEIGHVMGKKTVAEYVESDPIRQVIEEIGVDYAQGYAIGCPQPLSEISSSNLGNL